MGTATLWLLIALAAAGGVRALVAVPSRGGNPQPALIGGGDARGFAELWLGAYLEAGAGQEASLRAFYPRPVDLAGVTPAGRYVPRTAAVAERMVGPGYWAVTVAADVLVAVPGGYQQAGTSYYRIGVLAGPKGLVATSLPALVPPPAPGGLPRPAAPPLAAPTDDATTATVQAFFDAYLAGHGSPQATTVPASAVQPITPAPFTTDTVLAIGLGAAGSLPPSPGAHGPRAGGRLASVEVAALDPGGRKELLDYALSLTDRQGRWEVDGMLPALPQAAGT